MKPDSSSRTDPKLADTFQTKWARQTKWQLYLPPGRPSDSHLALFRQLLGRSSMAGGQVCVLGSTPELCDLVIELGWDLTVIDRSKEFYRMVQTLRVFPDVGTVIFDDWADALGAMKGRFHAILADLVLGNISYGSRPRFLGAVRSALSRTSAGYLEKIFTAEANAVAPYLLERRFENRALNLLTINDFANVAFFRSSLLSKHEVIQPDLVYDDYRRLWQTNPRMNALLEEAYSLFPAGTAWFYGRPWPDVLDLYQEVFHADFDWMENSRASPFRRCLRIIRWMGNYQ